MGTWRCSSFDLHCFLMYDNTENAFSQKRVVPNGERTFIAPADICGYSFANEIQNSVKVILVWIVIFNRGHLTGHPMLQSNLMTDGGYLILWGVIISSGGVVSSGKYLSNHWEGSWRWLLMDCFTMFWLNSFSSRKSLSSENTHSSTYNSASPMMTFICGGFDFVNHS